MSEALIKFYFKYCHSLWKKENLAFLRKYFTDNFQFAYPLFLSLKGCFTLTGLETWTFMFLYALSPCSNFMHSEIEHFLPTTEASSSLLEMLMESFYIETKCEPLFAAAAFLSWILRHLGLLCDNENTVSIEK